MNKLQEELAELRKIDWAQINNDSPEEVRLCERYIALAMINLYSNEPDKLIEYLSIIWNRGYKTSSNRSSSESNPFK